MTEHVSLASLEIPVSNVSRVHTKVHMRTIV